MTGDDRLSRSEATYEKLFGPRGACAGCWCMWARLPRAEYVRGLGETNRRAFRALVKSGTRPGLIAYVDREPAGWCAVAPRPDFRRLRYYPGFRQKERVSFTPFIRRGPSTGN